MKKIAVIFPLLFILAFSSCTVKQAKAPEKLISEFNCAITITKGDEVFSGSFVYSKQGKMTVTVLKPQNLKGIKYIMDSENLYVMSDDVKIKNSSDKTPCGSYIKLVYSATSSVLANRADFEYKNDLLKYSGKADNIKFIFCRNKDGSPISIEFPSENLKVKFT